LKSRHPERRALVQDHTRIATARFRPLALHNGSLDKEARQSQSMVDASPTGTTAFTMFGYTVANEQSSFQSKSGQRLTRKLGSNVIRQTLFEFGATNFTERFLKAIFHRAFFLRYIITLTPLTQFSVTDEHSAEIAGIENESLSVRIAFRILGYTAANEPQSFRSKSARRLTRKLRSNVS
jgi:hypothetical protein